MPELTVDPVYVPFPIVTPAGTTAAAPQTTALAVPPGILEAVDVLIPDGHQGLTGIRFTLSQQQILPWSNVAVWLIGNGLAETFDVNVEVDTHLAAVTYNTGRYPHTHYVRCRIRQLAPSSGMPHTTLIPVDRLNTP